MGKKSPKEGESRPEAWSKDNVLDQTVTSAKDTQQ